MTIQDWEPEVRTLTEGDLPSIRDIFGGLMDFFYERDVIAAQNCMEAYLEDKADAEFWVMEWHNSIIGVIGCSRDFSTDGSYLLQSFAVSAKYRGNGFGKSLLRSVEEQVRKKGGRMLYAWSSTEDYCTTTRGFYQSMGYELVATVPDYWQDGDSLAIFGKRLT